MESRERRAEAFVRDFIHRFWAGDIDYFTSVLTDDFVLIAAQDDQYYLDREQSIGFYRDLIASIPGVVLIDEDYSTVLAQDSVTVVSGSFYGINNPDTGTAFSARQRVTVVLRDADDGGFKIAHMHISNPISILRKGEYFPVGFSREAYRYVRMLASQYSDRASIEVREIGGATHVLRTFDVVYLEADRQYTMVHCLSKTLRARQGIGALSKRFPADRFFEVRRGSIVNILHVISWNAEAVTLTGGVEIPIPARRSTEVRDKIEELRRLVSGGGLLLTGRAGGGRAPSSVGSNRGAARGGPDAAESAKQIPGEGPIL